jgi:hypothetical protein
MTPYEEGEIGELINSQPAVEFSTFASWSGKNSKKTITSEIIFDVPRKHIYSASKIKSEAFRLVANLNPDAEMIRIENIHAVYNPAWSAGRGSSPRQGSNLNKKGK